jgi:hypothetical protein
LCTQPKPDILLLYVAQFWYCDALIDDAIIPDCVPCHKDSAMEMVMTMLFNSFMPEMISLIQDSTMDHDTADQSHRGGTTDHQF